MAAEQQRDPELTAKRLAEWLSAKIPGSSDVVISSLAIPPSGFANETIYFGARWTESGRARREQYVVRVQAAENQFLDPDIALQYKMMHAMARRSDVPVPPLHWFESDPTVFGRPFYVMGRIDGRVTTEVPSYHQAGWVADLSAAERERWWSNAMAAFAAVAKLDWRDGFTFLDQGDGEPGLDRYLDYVSRWHGWASRGRDLGVIDQGLEWLLANRPSRSSVGVVWGDSRVGNMIFADDLSVGAVIDWEMATLGPPEADLGWWLFFERFLTEGFQVPGLDGIPGREDTIAQYAALTGIQVRDIEYYEVLASLRMAVISLRFNDQRIDAGLLSKDSTMRTNGPAAQILAKQLGLPVPNLALEFAATIAQLSGD